MCAVIALAASCRQTRSTLLVNVSLEPPAPPVKNLEIEVKQAGRAPVKRTFDWQPDHAQLGIFLPDDISGMVQVVGRAFDDSGVVASGEGSATIIPRKVSQVLDLILSRIITTPPPDGGMPNDGAADAGADQDEAAEAGPDASDSTDADVADAPAEEPDDGGADSMADAPDAAGDARPPGVVIDGDGFGRYCSTLYPPTGWALNYSPDLTMDPCQYLRDRFGPGTVERAGLYSKLMENKVVVRCETGGAWLGVAAGIGEVPFERVFNMARDGLHKSCVFTAAPAHMPVLGSPFRYSRIFTNGSVVDFARPPYEVLTLADFGTAGSQPTSRLVDNHGQDLTVIGNIDDYDGFDLVMASGTPLAAVADGTVMAARFRPVARACDWRSSETQGELFIKHVIEGGPNSTDYDEVLVTYYAHLSMISVTEGQKVKRGDPIGQSGNTGCTTEPKLKLSVYRLTNTAGWKLFPFTINTDFGFGKDQKSSNGDQVMIDPGGFQANKGFDPWATLAYPMGALSINLWRGLAP